MHLRKKFLALVLLLGVERGIGERHQIQRSAGRIRAIKYFNLQWKKRNVHYWKIGQMNENICAVLIKSHFNKSFIVACSYLTWQQH